MNEAVEQLLGRATGPVGPSVEVDFGMASGPFAELAAMLTRVNGFFACNAGAQVFHTGAPGPAPELLHWNDQQTWKHTYQGMADRLFCFGQDVLGTQYAIQDGQQVVTFDPETAQTTPIGESIADWAAWLLDDPDVNATAGLAKAWQDANRPLALDERLIPSQFFILGGEYTLDNLVARDAAVAMRIRGPIAVQLKSLPDGANVKFVIE